VPLVQATFNEWGRDQQDQAVIKTDGSAFVDILQPKVGWIWEIQMVTGTTVKYAQSSMSLLKDGVLPVGTFPMQYLNFTMNTYGASATAVGPPYVYLQHGESLRVSLTGGAVGDRFTVWYLYREGVPY
jgi:hypothetical protein